MDADEPVQVAPREDCPTLDVLGDQGFSLCEEFPFILYHAVPHLALEGIQVLW